jgi:HD-like signal output (HDOD) protein
MISTHSATEECNPILHRFAQIESLPPMPCSLRSLLRVVQNEKASAAELVELIENDEGLSAKILRISNSAYYGVRGKVQTLSRAVMTIGFHEVRSICLFSLLLGSFPVSGRFGRLHRERLWKHALATANHASGIARVRSWISREEAFDLGLLHDLGWLAMLVHYRDDFELVNQLAESEEIPLWEAESHFDLKHVQIGRWIAVKWGLPEAYESVMAFHHSPERSRSFQPQARIVFLANALSHCEEYPELVGCESVKVSCRALRISESEWQEHVGRVQDVKKEVNKLWQLLG